MDDYSENFRIKLIEVDDAEPLAGALFKKSFNQVIPDFPKHFILLMEVEEQQPVTLGYVHFTQVERIYLGGGMCVNTLALRHVPHNIRRELNQQGGVAFTLLSEAVKQLHDCDAVFGYVGHKGAYKIDLAVGFEPTKYPHLIVYWKQALSQQQQQNLIEQAHHFGAF